MGRWGERFFEGDNDLDEASNISADAGIELYHYVVKKTSKDVPFDGKGLEATRAHLNNGVLETLIAKYSKPAEKGYEHNRNLRLVLLAALAMRVGATIPLEFILELATGIVSDLRVSPKYSSPLFDSGFRAPMKDQIDAALKYYKNDGTPFDFDALRCMGSECAKSEQELDKEKGEKLMKCGKCGLVYYCSKDCQKDDWSEHKKSCKTPKQREEADRKRWPGKFRMMNV